MKLRTLCLAVPVVYAIGALGWTLFESREPVQDAAVASAVPSVVGETIDGAAQPLMADVTGPTRRAVIELVDFDVTTPEEVREVMRITKEATSRDRKALVGVALESEDALVCGNAVLALGRLGAFNSDEALLALIFDDRVRVRQDAVKACGLDGRDDALPHLERALAETDATLRPLVLEALGEIGGPQASALVRGVADDSTASKTDRVFARVALERMSS